MDLVNQMMASRQFALHIAAKQSKAAGPNDKNNDNVDDVEDVDELAEYKNYKNDDD